MKDLRYLAVLPLLFGLWTTVIYIMKDQAYQLLWFCNVNCFLMAIGLFYRSRLLVWSSTIWLFIGTPLWIYEDYLLSDFRLHAVFVHIGSCLVGWYFIHHHRGKPKWILTFSISTAFIIQGFARWLTLPEYNVNMAHRVYPTLAKVFPEFWMYNIFNYISFIIVIFILVKLLGLKYSKPS